MFYQFTTGLVSKKDVHHTVSGKTIKFESFILNEHCTLVAIRVHSCLIVTLQNRIIVVRLPAVFKLLITVAGKCSFPPLLTPFVAVKAFCETT